jgi:triosephosphate isomerase
MVGEAPLGIGAQNVWHERQGAFTGEVSPTMLVDTGCRFAIVGHSERRNINGETDQLVALKTRAVLEQKLPAILCVGESERERDEGQTEGVLRRQLDTVFSSVDVRSPDSLTIAYEPVWAIGTGKTATPDVAQEAHAFIRQLLSEYVGADVAEGMALLYGGSVKPDNAAGLFGMKDIDGGLIGGASLDAESFMKIVLAAKEQIPE